MKYLKALFIIGMAWFTPLIRANAQLSLAKVFSSDMVLQRDQPLGFWGKAIPGTIVTVRLFGSNHTDQRTSGSETRVAADSTWHLALKAQKASTLPQTIQVISQKDTLSLTNVLIGDIWICAGQSNMAFMLKNDRFAAANLKKAVNPNLRLLNWQPSVSV